MRKNTLPDQVFSARLLAHEEGCPWDASTCRAAASGGHLACLQYAHEQGCDWDARTCRAAAYEGRLACLQYAHEEGCDWDARTCRAAAYEGLAVCVDFGNVCVIVCGIVCVHDTPVGGGKQR